MTRSLRFLALLGLAGWLASAAPQRAGAQPQPVPAEPGVTRARELFGLGVHAYERGLYFDALRYFQDAYQLRPHPAVRVNIANCFDKLDRPAEAILNFQLFLESGAGSSAQQAEVREALARLRRRVGRLVLNVAPEGAQIAIDGKDARRAPVTDALLLKAGRHQVTVSLEGHETAIRVVDIAAEGTVELGISLGVIGAPPATPSAAAQPEVPQTATPSAATVGAGPAATLPAGPASALDAMPPEPEPRPTTQPLPQPSATSDTALEAPAPMLAEAEEHDSVDVPLSVWLAGGATVVTLLAAVVTGQLALAADRDFDGDLAAVRNQNLNDAQRAAAWLHGVDAADRARDLAVTTDILLTVSIGGAVLTTVLYLNRGAETERALIAPVLGPQGAGLTAHGKF